MQSVYVDILNFCNAYALFLSTSIDYSLNNGLYERF